MRIIKYKKGSKGLYKVELDDGRVLSLYEDVILKFDLLLKKEIMDSDLDSINKYNTNDTKNFVLTITDKRLLAKTGGIVQGMSGCPVVQNGKLIGAVTHVFVNDPTKGYGIFVENMM